MFFYWYVASLLECKLYKIVYRINHINVNRMQFHFLRTSSYRIVYTNLDC